MRHSQCKWGQENKPWRKTVILFCEKNEELLFSINVHIPAGAGTQKDGYRCSPLFDIQSTTQWIRSKNMEDWISKELYKLKEIEPSCLPREFFGRALCRHEYNVLRRQTNVASPKLDSSLFWKFKSIIDTFSPRNERTNSVPTIKRPALMKPSPAQTLFQVPSHVFVPPNSYHCRGDFLEVEEGILYGTYTGFHLPVLKRGPDDELTHSRTFSVRKKKGK